MDAPEAAGNGRFFSGINKTSRAYVGAKAFCFNQIRQERKQHGRGNNKRHDL